MKNALNIFAAVGVAVLAQTVSAELPVLTSVDALGNVNTLSSDYQQGYADGMAAARVVIAGWTNDTAAATRIVKIPNMPYNLLMTAPVVDYFGLCLYNVQFGGMATPSSAFLAPFGIGLIPFSFSHMQPCQ